MPPKHLVRLTRQPPRRSVRPVALGPGAELAPGRAHELCGAGRITLAAILAGMAAANGGGPVLWIRPAWAEGRLNPDGLRTFLDPARLVMASPSRGEDVLWSMEEALRSGACAAVVAEPPAAPGLTPVRRLHLAAEAGAEKTGRAPLGLLLTPGAGGAQGVETRWRLSPAPGWAAALEGGAEGPADAHAAWRLELLRARALRPQVWEMRWRGGRPALGPLGGRTAPTAAPVPAREAAATA